MAHQRHADFLQDAGLHQAGVEGVAEVVETDVANPAVFEGRFPGGLENPDLLSAVAENNVLVLAGARKLLEEPRCKRNLPCFAFRGL